MKFDVVTHMDRGLILGGHPRPLGSTPPPQGGVVPALSNFWVSFYYTYTLYHRTTNVDTATHMGRGLFLYGQLRP